MHLINLFFCLSVAAPDLTQVICKKDDQGYCTSGAAKIIATYKDPSPVIRMNVGLARTMDIHWSKDVTVRKINLANPTFFSIEKIRPNLARITINLNKVKASEKEIIAHQEDTDVILPLDGVTLNLVLRIQRRDKHVHEVRIEFPERDQETEYVRRKMKAEWQKVSTQLAQGTDRLKKMSHQLAEKMMINSLLERFECNEFNNFVPFDRRRGSTHMLHLWANKLCRIGKFIAIFFRLRNREYDVFNLDKIKVLGDEKELDIKWIFTGERQTAVLRRNEEALGIAYFTVGDPPAKEYTLIVSEDGGKQRIVEVDDLEF